MDTHLKRVHGVTRYTFTDIPANVRYVVVSMDGLTSSGCIMGTYIDDYDYSVRIPVNLARALDERTSLGPFPTADRPKSNF